MAVSKISNVALKKKTYSVKDLNSLSSFSLDCKFNKGEILPTFGYEGTDKTYAGEIKNFYNLLGKYYFIAEDGKLYHLSGSSYVRVSNYTFLPNTKAIVIKSEGVKKTLFINEDRAIIAESETVIDIPCGKFAMVFKDSLYIADYDKLYFSKPLYATDFSSGIDNGGYFDIEEGLGDICAITNNGEYVLVLCSHGVKKISSIGDRMDCVVKNLDLPYFNVTENTAKEVASALCFIEDDSLKVIKDGKLKSFDLPLKNLSWTVKSVSSFNNYYCLVVNIYGMLDDVTLMVNIDDGDFFFVSKRIFDGGYFLDNTENEFKKLSEKEEFSGTWTFKGLPVDLNEHGRKRITDIQLESKGTATLTVTFNNEQKRFTINDGCNAIRTNLVSENFSFMITATGNSGIKNIKIKYVLLGE